jgi:hypothetical protein
MKILSVLLLSLVMFTQSAFAQDDHNDKIQSPTPSSSETTPVSNNGPDDHATSSSDTTSGGGHK